MIRIEKHTRGLAISSPEGADRNPHILRLGQALADRAYLSKGRLVAPLEAAADVLEIFGTDAVSWDEDILDRATKQRIQRQMQLRARLEVVSALESPLDAIADYPRTQLLDRHQIEAVQP